MAVLLETYRSFIYPWQMGHVGHMNVQFHTARFNEATWHFFARFGLTPGFLKDNHRGMAALDQRIQYKERALAGSLLHIQTELLKIKRKTVRFVHHMYNNETGDEVAMAKLVGTYLDKDTRKTTELPQSAIETGESWLITSAASSRLAADSNIH